ncbi:DUF397 domain-containing protein, partial [Nocardia sp. NPDC004604]|uniref:DUF397 domain-containing protein n=1 Tax=Nocardia sp. NPDC004604 TaxID=3157013 RepID=UPI0033BF82F6
MGCFHCRCERACRVSADLLNADWFKSTRSGGSKDCVEVAFLGDGQVGVSRAPTPWWPSPSTCARA